jgi:hypothetical protein
MLEIVNAFVNVVFLGKSSTKYNILDECQRNSFLIQYFMVMDVGFGDFVFV